MQRLKLLISLLVVCSLAGCGGHLDPPAAARPTALPAPSSTLTQSLGPTATHAPTKEPTGSPSPTPSPESSATCTATSSPAPTATPTFTPTPVNTLPPLKAAVAGDTLALSLGWEMGANGHLTAGGCLDGSGTPGYILTSLGRRVYALSEEGRLQWQAAAKGPVYALAVLNADQIVIGDDAGDVSVLGADGQLVWTHNLGSRVTAVHGSWQGGVLAGGWDERLTFLDGGDAGERVRWQSKVDGPVSDVVGLPGIALVATLGGQIWAFAPEGHELWHHDLGSPVCSLDATETGQRFQVLLGLQDGRLVALGTDGALQWQQSLGPDMEGCPVIATSGETSTAESMIVAGTGGPSPVLALLSDRGEHLWRLAVPAPVGAVAILDLDADEEEEVLAGLANGEVRVFDVHGRERGSVNAGLAVWHFLQRDCGPGAVVLADVVAWELTPGDGSAGGPWLRPPAMLQTLPSPLLTSAQHPGSPEAGLKDEAILIFLGDVALGRTVELQLARFGPAYPWTGLEPLLAQADFLAANLECALTTQGRPLDKSYLIRAHPLWGRTLVEAGIDVVSVANNHALDYGDAGLNETLDTLGELGIGAVGAGNWSDEAHRPTLSSVNGIKVAVLAYAAARWNGSVDVPATDRLAWAYPETVQADVRAVRDQADFVVVILHAGTEYAGEPSRDQVQVAHAAVDAGADLVVGHHPHVTQTVEQYGRGLIVYSLGDALFDIPRQAAMRGHLLRVRITVDGLAQAELWPFWIEDGVRPRLLADGHGQARVTVIYP